MYTELSKFVLIIHIDCVNITVNEKSMTNIWKSTKQLVSESLFNLVHDFVLFSKNFDCWLTLLVGVFAQLGRKVSEEILQLLRAKIRPDFVKRIQQTRI